MKKSRKRKPRTYSLGFSIGLPAGIDPNSPLAFDWAKRLYRRLQMPLPDIKNPLYGFKRYRTGRRFIYIPERALLPFLPFKDPRENRRRLLVTASCSLTVAAKLLGIEHPAQLYKYVQAVRQTPDLYRAFCRSSSTGKFSSTYLRAYRMVMETLLPAHDIIVRNQLGYTGSDVGVVKKRVILSRGKSFLTLRGAHHAVKFYDTRTISVRFSPAQILAARRSHRIATLGLERQVRLQEETARMRYGADPVGQRAELEE